jgi:hypothetical protein
MLRIGREAVVREGSGGGGTVAVTEHGGGVVEVRVFGRGDDNKLRRQL